jgi:glycosyltransferase involved in cell wall biosynthesis
VIVHLHGGFFRSYYEQEAAWMRALLKLALEKAAAAIVLGERFRPIFHGIVPDERIFVVPNGLDAGDLICEAAATGTTRQVLFLTNLIASKGFAETVHAAAAVVRVVPDARFVIAGDVMDTGVYQDVRQFVRDNGLEQSIAFPGPLSGEAKTSAFRSASLFVLPTAYPFEGQPFAILEAMAAGLPIITTDQGVIGEMVRDGVNGFIVPPGDHDALADKIILLLKDPELQERMGRASRERFLQNYTLDHWTENMAGVFTHVLARQ